MSEISSFFAEVALAVERELDRLIPAEGPGRRSLRDAMRWSLFAGGKRFRPSLIFASGRALGAADEDLISTAAAVEMIHTYSLIHDDLPSMDDDDLRRGRETCHKKFGEATAILAGDALQVLAFQAIAEDERLSETTRVALVSGLSRAATRMVVGQQHDLESEGLDLSIDEVKAIHVNKTGALIAFSAHAGALIAGGADDDRAAISAFGEKLGLLFQITDDLLDVTQATETLGKTAGKDRAAQKATYPAVLGLEGTKALIDTVHAETVASLTAVGSGADMLRAIAKFLVSRRS